MATQSRAIFTLSVLATAVVQQYQPVSYTGGVVAAGAAMKGLAVDTGAVGEMQPVDVLGTSIGIAGAAINTVGQQLSCDGAGNLIPTAGEAIVVARAEQTAAEGNFFEVFLLPS